MLDPYGARKATAKPDLKAGRKGACAVCHLPKTIYPVRVYPDDRPWESATLCSDCLMRLQREQMWPLAQV